VACLAALGAMTAYTAVTMPDNLWVLGCLLALRN
jgi:hypothetical protein